MLHDDDLQNSFRPLRLIQQYNNLLSLIRRIDGTNYVGGSLTHLLPTPIHILPINIKQIPPPIEAWAVKSLIATRRTPST